MEAEAVVIDENKEKEMNKQDVGEALRLHGKGTRLHHQLQHQISQSDKFNEGE